MLPPMSKEPAASTAPGAFGRLPDVIRGGVWMLGFCMTFAVLMAIIRHVSATLHPFEIAFFRNLFGLVVMLPWLLRAGAAGLRTQRLGMHVGRAVSGTAAMLCLFTAVAWMPLADATALTFTSPLFATVGAALILRETVRLRRWSATAVGFLGVLVILRPGAATIDPASLVALAAALIATSMLAMKSLSRTETPNAVVVYMGLLMTPMSLLPALFVWEWPSMTMLALLAAVGAIAALGQQMMVRAFASAEASAVLPFDFARLVFTAGLGFVFFGERPDAWTWVGAGIILTATVYIAHREARLGRETPRDGQP